MHAEPPYVIGLSVSDKGPIDAGSCLAAFAPDFFAVRRKFLTWSRKRTRPIPPRRTQKMRPQWDGWYQGRLGSRR